MRAFGYVRLSKEDRDSTSPQRQRERIERLCRERGWELVEIFEDIDVSAFNGKRRPGFDRMMRRLPEAGAIVFWRLDRLSRSVLDFSKLLDDTQRAGIQLVSTDQPIDTSSAMGTAFVQMTAVFAQLEAGTLSERSRQMMAYKREKGEPVGRVPFGWRREGKDYIPDPEQQAVLREAAKRYVAGGTFNAIAKDLGMHTAALSRMLQSSRVIEALPSDVGGKLAKAIVARKGSRVPTSQQSLLGDIATCGECGSSMTVTSTRVHFPAVFFRGRCPSSGRGGGSESSAALT
jgi:site-specific DNA recombinase